MKFYSKTDFDSCLWQEQLFYWAYVVIWSFSLAAHKCWWTWKTFLSKENDQIISIKSCYFSTGYHYSIWYFKTRPWTCTTIPHLSNTHGYPKTKFRAKQRRSRAITSARSTVMLRVERMNTWGKQRKQQSYVAQMNTQGFPCKDIWTLCQSLPWKRMYSSSICRCGGVWNPASLQRPCPCAPVAWAQRNKAKEANRASAAEIRTP